jgi:hypothetical protein
VPENDHQRLLTESARVRAHQGVHAEPSALMPHEVTGLAEQRRGPSNEVTMRRLRMM